MVFNSYFNTIYAVVIADQQNFSIIKGTYKLFRIEKQ
jgi:hypothetical protein